MRRMVLAVMLAGSAHVAQAADMPDFSNMPLRGAFSDGLSSSTRNWNGYYAGGQVGFSNASIDFANAPSSLTGFILRNSVLQAPVSNWALLEKKDITGTGFGGFVGRNYQWEDVVLGVEANYNHYSGLSSSSSNQMSRRLTNPAGATLPAGHTDVYDVTLSGNAALQIKDVMTFRARAGWATGNFLPYMFGGLAVARVDVSRSATVNSNETDVFDGTDPGGNPIHTETPLSTLNITSAESRPNSFVAGYTAGLGTEMMVFGNVFARAEWEYVKFLKVKDIATSNNTVRLGIGYKF